LKWKLPKINSFQFASLQTNLLKIFSPKKKHWVPQKQVNSFKNFNNLSSSKKWYQQKSKTWLTEVLQEINYKQWFILIACGCLAGLSLPNSTNFTLSFFESLIAWFALAPVFVILWSVKGVLAAFLRAFVAGLCFNLVGFRFLLGIHPLSWLGVPDNLSVLASAIGLLIAATQQAFYWGIYGILIKWLQRIYRVNYLTVFCAAMLWVVWIEKIANSASLGGNPWTSLYLSQHNNIYLIQIVDLFGASAVSFLLISVNVSLAYWIYISLQRKSSFEYPVEPKAKELITAISLTLQTASLFLIFLIYGIWHLNFISYQVANSPSVQALLLQTNLQASETRFEKAAYEKNLQSYVTLLRKVYTGIPTLLVLPEGAIVPEKIDRFKHEIEKVSPQLSFLTGSYFVDGKFDSYNAVAGVNLSFVSNKTSCSLVKRENSKKQFYLKQVLVPFGEYTPLEKICTELLKMFQLESLAKSTFKAGEQAVAFNFTFGRISPLVCFEIIFPEIVSKQIKAGAQALTLLGDASWFHQDKQLVGSVMLAASQFRAIEGRRDILLVVNKGPLAHINKNGRIQGNSEDSEFLYVNFQLNKETSFFTRSQ
jgi:apolipoprotein N-acyltransferase